MTPQLLIACHSDFTVEQIDALAEGLPSERRARVKRHRSIDARFGETLAYALLALGAKRLIGADSLPSLAYGENGKPDLPDLPLTFSISHAEHATAVLLAHGELDLGLDLERVRQIRRPLLRRFASDDEIASLSSADDAITLWTKKEAVAKRSGAGLRGDLRDIATNDTHSLYLTLSGLRSVLSFSPASVADRLTPTIVLPHDLVGII